MVPQLFVATIAIVIFAHSTAAIKLQERFAWQQMEYDWPSAEAKQQAIDKGIYVPANNLPLGMDVWRDKLFVTVPRWKAGVASSLNYIQLKDDGNKSPLLRPYPSWEANTIVPSLIASAAASSSIPTPSSTSATTSDSNLATTSTTPTSIEGKGRADAPDAIKSARALTDNATIVSTFRIRVDECDRLWVMDTGLADILGQPEQIAPPALVIFDLKTDKLLRRYEFPDADAKEDTFFANVIVDVQKSACDDAFAYVPDLGAYGVVVYSLRDNKSWRVKHNFFHFDPLHGEYSVGGVQFQWTDGVFGMALGKAETNGDRAVYFHALSSTKEFVVSNRVLQNETHATGTSAYYDYKLLGDRGENGQSSAEFFDDTTGVLFYTQVNKDGVGCWKSGQPYTTDTQGLVDSDSDALVFPNDLKIDGDRLWVLSDRMPVFLYKKLDATQFNYRILSATVADAIRGTACETTK